MKNNQKKILIYSVLGFVTLLIVTLTITYAYWILTKQQTGENVVNTACLNITFTGENDITLDKAYPMNEEQLASFLSSATPYHFTIHNECSELASASINLESLTVSGKALEDDYIDAILYENNYNTSLNRNKKLTSNTPNDENKVISDAKHAYSLYNFNLKPDETRNFNLLLYMDPDTPMVEDNMNASWKGKITLSSNYKLDSKSLRIIKYNDKNGMWGYKDKITKIVIEDTKSEKQSPEGGVVYGPFDESEYGTNAVESYVVCEADDTNCIGYIQSDGKVIANPDSSILFNGFKNVTTIEGLNNLNTHNVINMTGMFQQLPNLQSLDISSFDTSNVTNMSYMFNFTQKLKTINFGNINTSKVSNMSAMFEYCGLTSLNFNNINTSHVNNMSYMFAYMDNLDSIELKGITMTSVKDMSYMFSSSKFTNITLEEIDTSNVENMRGMFGGNSVIETLDISNLNTSSVTDMYGMFQDMTALTNIIFPTDFGIAALDISYMFARNGIANLNLSNFNTKNSQKMTGIFLNCKNIKTLDLSSFDTSNIIDMTRIFEGTSLQSLDISNWTLKGNLSNFGNNNYLDNLQSLKLNNVNTSEVTNMYGMFQGLINLTTLDLSSFDTTNVTNMNNMFANTTNLQSITFGPKFVHKPDATTSGMFSGCPSLDRPSGDTWTDVSFN